MRAPRRLGWSLFGSTRRITGTAPGDSAGGEAIEVRVSGPHLFDQLILASKMMSWMSRGIGSGLVDAIGELRVDGFHAGAVAPAFRSRLPSHHFREAFTCSRAW